MNVRSKLTALLALAALLGSPASQAQVLPPQPVQWKVSDGGNGHYYLVIQGSGISWIEANTAAESSVFQGVNGHLATITSLGENNFVATLPGITSSNGYWLGGFQTRGTADPQADWEWVNGDGPIRRPNEPGFQRWANGEPDDLPSPVDILLQEDFMALSGGAWYSEAFNAALSVDGFLIQGYVVEYDVGFPNDGGGVIDPATCSAQQGGCQTIPEQTLTIPSTAEVQPGATIEFKVYRFNDPRVGQASGRCLGSAGSPSRRQLDVFRELDTQGDPALNGTLILPEYLCGSPEFTVVKTKITGVSIRYGTVLVQNEKLSPNQFVCDQPIPAGSDPQEQDTVVWQATDPTGMLEQTYDNQYASRIGRNWAGSAGELTTRCGSSEGETGGLSYFVIGLHIDFGQTWGSNATGIFNEFVLLTKYKLLMLRDAVDFAQPVLSEHDYRKLRATVDKMIMRVDERNFDDVLKRLARQFLSDVDSISYASDPSGFNHHGQHRARGRNIAYLLEVKVIPVQ